MEVVQLRLRSPAVCHQTLLKKPEIKAKHSYLVIRVQLKNHSRFVGQQIKRFAQIRHTKTDSPFKDADYGILPLMWELSVFFHKQNGKRTKRREVEKLVSH